jgi:hypothetical protein
MKNGVTPVDAIKVVPVLYVDLDIVDYPEGVTATPLGDSSELGVASIGAYPGLKSLLLSEHGPGGGNPVYRIEGPLPQLIKWLKAEYCGDEEQLTFFLESAFLAR